MDFSLNLSGIFRGLIFDFILALAGFYVKIYIEKNLQNWRKLING